jgi:hypothetical protein
MRELLNHVKGFLPGCIGEKRRLADSVLAMACNAGLGGGRKFQLLGLYSGWRKTDSRQ